MFRRDQFSCSSKHRAAPLVLVSLVVWLVRAVSK